MLTFPNRTQYKCLEYVINDNIHYVYNSINSTIRPSLFTTQLHTINKKSYRVTVTVFIIMSVPVTLMDGVDGEMYTINVTKEEATRINSGTIRVK